MVFCSPIIWNTYLAKSKSGFALGWIRTPTNITRRFHWRWKLEIWIRTAIDHIQTSFSHKIGGQVEKRRSSEKVAWIARTKDLSLSFFFYQTYSEARDDICHFVFWRRKSVRSVRSQRKFCLPWPTNLSIQPPHIPVSVKDYRKDLSGWVKQGLQSRRQEDVFNVVCDQCYAHDHYSLDSRLPYGRCRKVTASSKS